jgi:hypothetical protein
MAAVEGGTPVLLLKKMGGMILLVVGSALAAVGFGSDVRGLGVVGLLIMALGLVLLILKIVKRNQAGP